ncbi:hypothetical protein [Halodesulfovibrio aestuarii]|uniref:Uncharacterized protein n=1 Tax=Halodesulfovibrio aestuarii TaxID=126333 RepID=A0A8G2C748_9BACT|nr:hypothetical protein [Halodesulfovibrio aestuarii]SHI57106.1 hypothetical protein SAMN05660830_00339 [Halodesulfovibrio aestuarii]
MMRDVMWAVATVFFLVTVFFAGLVALWLLPFVLIFMLMTRRF